jgi:hypothetical protein
MFEHFDKVLLDSDEGCLFRNSVETEHRDAPLAELVAS